VINCVKVSGEAWYLIPSPPLLLFWEVFFVSGGCQIIRRKNLTYEKENKFVTLVNSYYL
jgi:hypothetical protein